MPSAGIETEIGERVWASRYRWSGDGGEGDLDIFGTWRRIARALASAEAQDRVGWEWKFYSLLEDFRFLPGGRIQAGAGVPGPHNLFNCFVMSRPGGDARELVRCLDDATRSLLAGGGLGYDFSCVPPADVARWQNSDLKSGPVPLLELWDALCDALGKGRVRGGAMLGSLRCDHPDIGAFIAAKRKAGTLHHFNLSVLVTDDFMAAVRNDEDWPLVYPLADEPLPDEDIVEKTWPGRPGPTPCRVWQRVRARELWDAIMRSNYDGAEPGVLFIDRIQRANNLRYAEEICTTNPCGEVPLPCYGACDLGSLNLTRFVLEPFTPAARLDIGAIRRSVPIAVRMLDNVYELSDFPLLQQRDTALACRRVGLGITGLADALIMLGLRYDSGAARDAAANLMRSILHVAYDASAELAREKGAFALFSATDYLGGAVASALPAALRAKIASHGLRNSHLIALAPTGSISLLAGGVSSGVEPLFATEYVRHVHVRPGATERIPVVDFAYRQFRRLRGAGGRLPDTFRSALEIDPADQLAMLATLQPCVDSAISKTISVAEDYPYGAFRSLYERAYDLGLKGCAAYRQGSYRGSVGVPG